MLSAVLFELEPFVAKGTAPRSGVSVCGLVSVSGTLLHKFLVAKVALKRQNIIVNPHVPGKRPTGVENSVVGRDAVRMRANKLGCLGLCLGLSFGHVKTRGEDRGDEQR